MVLGHTRLGRLWARSKVWRQALADSLGRLGTVGRLFRTSCEANLCRRRLGSSRGQGLPSSIWATKRPD